MSSLKPPPWDYRVIEKLLSNQRMSSYRKAAKNDLFRSFELYEWDMQASAGVLQTVGMVEVLARNAMDTHLTKWAIDRGETSWFESAPLDQKGTSDLHRAASRATRSKTLPSHGKIIAELSLGFWRYLVASRYLTTLWIPALSNGFPNGPADISKRRACVESHMDRLTFVRNRAAHHEPLHRRDLQQDLHSAVELARCIHVDAANWVSAKSPLSEIISAMPHIERRKR